MIEGDEGTKTGPFLLHVGLIQRGPLIGDYPWSTETFSGLRCGLRLFLPDLPSASRSCQTCTVVWKLSLPPPSLSSTGISPSRHLACLILSWHLLLGQILE